VARKDRERARKRHAIERARRAGGPEPVQQDEEAPARRAAWGPFRRRPGSPRAAARPGAGSRERRPAARAPAAPMRKMVVGDVDRRGRVYTRPMLLHPRIAMLVYFAVLAVGLVSLLRPGLQPLGYGAFAVGMLVIADSKPTWRHASLYIGLAVVLAAGAVAIAVARV
jgi:hypothetical protein